MRKFRKGFSEDSVSTAELHQEKIGAETVLNQRLTLFLIVFAVVLVGVLIAQKKILFLSLLFTGLVICWVLAYIVIIAARKVGYIAKQLYANNSEAKKIDRKGGGRSVRFLLGYFIPIFCSTLLTIAFMAGAGGFLDSYLWQTNVNISTTAVENKVKKVGAEIKKQLEPQKDSSSGNFKNVDSVILLSKPLPEGKKTTQAKLNVSAHVLNKKDKFSANFKNVDSVIASGNPLPAKHKNNVTRNQSLPQKIKAESNFKSIDSVIVNVKPGQLYQRTKEFKSDTAKTKLQKKQKPSPHFESIDSVIVKPK